MDFQVGDIVIKPSIGVCRIAEMRKVEVDGAQKDFFVFASGEVSVLVPVNNTDKSCIRTPMSSDQARSICGRMREPLVIPEGLTDRDVYRLHPKDIKDILRRRDPDELVDLVKIMYNKGRDFHQERKEKEFLESGIAMLAEEISYVQDGDRLETIKQLKEALNDAREERRRQLKKKNEE